MSLRINSEAPDFKAETTQGPLSFHEWIGDGWAILFSHPKDFTPVCTTELGYMASLQGEFAKRNTKILIREEIEGHEPLLGGGDPFRFSGVCPPRRRRGGARGRGAVHAPLSGCLHGRPCGAQRPGVEEQAGLVEQHAGAAGGAAALQHVASFVPDVATRDVVREHGRHIDGYRGARRALQRTRD